MIRVMKKRLIAVVLALTLALSAPTVSFASTSDEEAPSHDARLDGYKDGNMALKDASGTGLTWLLLVVLAAMCVGVMFINSKRTHLD
jgi:hypothetical protein